MEHVMHMAKAKLLSLEEALKIYFREIAKINNWKLNPDERVVNALIKSFIRNLKEHGNLYCPCRPEKTRETICPCIYAKEEIEQNGRCTCGLFVKGEQS